jgi:hypothetical protein
MKARLLVFAIGLSSLQSSCSITPPDSDGMCRQIARFANTSPFGSARTVRLTTDWGGVFSSSNVMAEKACLHGADKASKALCAYLLKNTSTEFAAVNYRRALTCIGREARGLSPTDDQLLPPSASSNVVGGKPVRSVVTVQFARGTSSSPPALSITTGESPAS